MSPVTRTKNHDNVSLIRPKRPEMHKALNHPFMIRPAEGRLFDPRALCSTFALADPSPAVFIHR